MLFGVVLAVNNDWNGVICDPCNESDNLLCCKELHYVTCLYGWTCGQCLVRHRFHSLCRLVLREGMSWNLSVVFHLLVALKKLSLSTVMFSVSFALFIFALVKLISSEQTWTKNSIYWDSGSL